MKSVPQNLTRILDAIRAAGRAKASPGEGAARSQDFLYDDEGLPR